MKVLFMFDGLPHYYNLVLNRLNQAPGLDIVHPKNILQLSLGLLERIDTISFQIVSQSTQLLSR